MGVASLVLGHDGIWGDLLSVSPEGVARIGKLLGLWRQVRDSIAVAVAGADGSGRRQRRGAREDRARDRAGRDRGLLHGERPAALRLRAPRRARALGDPGHGRDLRRPGPGDRGRGFRDARGRDRVLRRAGALGRATGGEAENLVASRSCVALPGFGSTTIRRRAGRRADVTEEELADAGTVLSQGELGSDASPRSRRSRLRRREARRRHRLGLFRDVRPSTANARGRGSAASRGSSPAGRAETRQAAARLERARAQSGPTDVNTPTLGLSVLHPRPRGPTAWG